MSAVSRAHDGRPVAALGLATLALAAGAIALGESRALAATSTNCPVNASGGYANCLSYAGPGYEMVKAYHAAGLPYRFQLHRPADGARWGYWQWNDRDYHVISLNLSGSITAQVNNLGTANPATYYVELG